jgi:hypothetical protein
VAGSQRLPTAIDPRSFGTQSLGVCAIRLPAASCAMPDASSDWGDFVERQEAAAPIEEQSLASSDLQSVATASSSSDDAWCQGMIDQESAVQEFTEPGWSKLLEVAVTTPESDVAVLNTTAAKEIALRWLATCLPHSGPMLYKLATSGKPGAISGNAQFIVDSATQPSAIVMTHPSTFIDTPGALDMGVFSLSAEAGAALATIAAPRDRPLLLVHFDAGVMKPELHKRLTSRGMSLQKAWPCGSWVLESSTPIPDIPLGEVRSSSTYTYHCQICASLPQYCGCGCES